MIRISHGLFCMFAHVSCFSHICLVFLHPRMYSAMLSDAPTNAGRPKSIVLSGLSKPYGMPGLRTLSFALALPDDWCFVGFAINTRLFSFGF